MSYLLVNTAVMYSSYNNIPISCDVKKESCLYSVAAVHCVFPSVSVLSQVRECLKLDQDDKECFAHYKQVKKLSKQLDSAEELISEQRC